MRGGAMRGRAFSFPGAGCLFRTDARKTLPPGDFVSNFVLTFFLLIEEGQWKLQNYAKTLKISVVVSPCFGGIFDYAGKERRLQELDELSGRPDFWDRPEQASALLKEQTQLKELVSRIQSATTHLEETQIYLDLAKESGDESVLSEAEETLKRAQDTISQMEFERMLSGPDDEKYAIVSINAGAGGTEAQDWAMMLLRMYLRYCERKGWKVEETDLQEGEEAGIKSATFRVMADYAYGFLKAEDGVHRLVRISPFDSQSRRHTSFASVTVFPEIDDAITVEIDEKDIRIDVFRSSGAGGQKVNKTSSAVRITHFPTGIVVSCQNERSQHKNKDMAFKILRARLYAKKQEEERKKLDAIFAQKKEIAWGSQIRSYVLQPYQQIKDHRTDLAIGNVTAVLDGDLDPFVNAYLIQEGSTAQPAAQANA